MSISAHAYLTEAEVTAKLQGLEMKHDLMRHQLDGWCIWPVLRFTVSRLIQHVPFDAPRVQHFSRGELLRLAIKDLFGALRLRRARYVVKTYSSSHSEIQDGRKKDILFDDVLRTIPGGVKIEVVNQRAAFLDSRPRLVPSDLTMVGIGLVAERLARRWRPKRVLGMAEEISSAICAEFGAETVTPEKLRYMIASYHWQKWLLGLVLRRVRPQFVLFGDSGDYPITAAAKELNAQAIEFQHGFTHRHYPANSWAAGARAHRARMPLPDRVLLYGRHWREELEAGGFWRDELVEIGSTRVDTYRSRPRNIDCSRCHLVVTTQGTDTGRMVEFLREFSALASGVLDFRLSIKMHPAYPTDWSTYRDAFGENPAVRLVAGTDVPTTFELLREADLHASIYSTCHYEALALGVPTIILPMTGAENVLHLHRDGHAFHPQNPRELVEIAVRWREHAVPAGVGERFFIPGAMLRIARELGQASTT